MDVKTYTDREVSEMLKLSPKNGYKTIQLMAKRGKIKGFQIGNRWRFTEESLRAFMCLNARQVRFR